VGAQVDGAERYSCFEIDDGDRVPRLGPGAEVAHIGKSTIAGNRHLMRGHPRGNRGQLFTRRGIDQRDGVGALVHDDEALCGRRHSTDDHGTKKERGSEAQGG
jgi:hypothetical protein